MGKVLENMVKKGIYQCLMDDSNEEYETQCWDCPYYSEGLTVKECKKHLLNDFDSLMKEKKGIIRCVDCVNHNNNGCRFFRYGVRTKDEWFCADGERKSKRN